MSEMHLRQPRFTYSACGPFTKNKERIQKFKEPGDSKYIYQNELYKACFQHDIAYGDFKDLPRRTIADNILRDKAFSTAKNPKYDGYQSGIASIVFKLLDKRTASLAQRVTLATRDKSTSNTKILILMWFLKKKELTEE